MYGMYIGLSGFRGLCPRLPPRLCPWTLLAVAARGSVAPVANVRPAAPPCPRSKPTKECTELPSVRMGLSPGRKWIWCILNATDCTEHVWWTDIESYKAFNVLINDRIQAGNFFIFLDMPPPGKCCPGRMPPFAPLPLPPPLPAGGLRSPRLKGPLGPCAHCPPYTSKPWLLAVRDKIMLSVSIHRA